jgi:hypothetical protein
VLASRGRITLAESFEQVRDEIAGQSDTGIADDDL